MSLVCESNTDMIARAGEMALLMTCLSCKHVDLYLIHRTYIKIAKSSLVGEIQSVSKEKLWGRVV